MNFTNTQLISIQSKEQIAAWNALKNGSEKSLSKLYDHFFEPLFLYCRKFTRNDAIIEDCLQDLFVMLWKKRDSLSEVTSVSSYLFRSAKNNLIRAIQKENKTDELNFLPELEEENLQDQLIASEMKSERSRKLKFAMDQLTSKQKEILYLKYELGFTNEEICDSLGINNQSVRNMLSRTIKKMRDLLLLFISLLKFEIFMNHVSTKSNFLTLL